MLGKPVSNGTRIAVESVVTERASGYRVADVLKAHPHLPKKIRQQHSGMQRLF